MQDEPNAPPRIERVAGIPLPDSWPFGGISGLTSRGPVLAFRVYEPETPAEFNYRLWLPVDELYTADGSRLLMYSGAEDIWETDGSGGVIDVATRELGVEWSVDVADFTVAKAWHDQRSNDFFDTHSPSVRKSWHRTLRQNREAELHHPAEPPYSALERANAVLDPDSAIVNAASPLTPFDRLEAFLLRLGS